MSAPGRGWSRQEGRELVLIDAVDEDAMVQVWYEVYVQLWRAARGRLASYMLYSWTKILLTEGLEFFIPEPALACLIIFTGL